MQTPAVLVRNSIPQGILPVFPLEMASEMDATGGGLAASSPSEPLTLAQLQAARAQWRIHAAAGDEAARRVAGAQDWVAPHPGKQEAKPSRLTDRVSQWLGL